MSTYRINGIKYNPANWAGLDPAERAACNRFAAARERELNTITATAWKCQGGPFNGHPVELESTTDRTAPMNVGAWAGHYELQTDPEHVKTHGRPSVASQAPRVLVWVGNDGGKAINTHNHTTDEKKAGADVTGRGFDQLRDLLADLGEDPTERATGSPLGPRARYTIGRTTYTIAATAEAADRLRARILKAKRWFSDKLLSAPAPAPVEHDESAPGAPAIIAASLAIATAQAQAAETCDAQGAADLADTAAELVTCDGPEMDDTAAAVADTPAGGCDAIGADHTPTEAAAADYTDPRETRAQAGGYTDTLKTRAPSLRAELLASTTAQKSQSRTGAWRAVFFRTSSGAAGLQFVGPDGVEHFSDHATGGERMRALQAMAQAAEQAHQQASASQVAAPVSQQAPDCTDPHETPAAAPDCTTPHETLDDCEDLRQSFTLADLEQVARHWTPEQCRQQADRLEQINDHGGALAWRCIAAGALDLAQRAAAVNVAHDRAGHLTPTLASQRDAIAEQLRQRMATDCTEAPETQAPETPASDAPEFQRARPANVDLRALIAQGMTPADLVGLGVVYSGDMANASGHGAIVEAHDGGARGVLVAVTLEDGRHMAQLDGYSFAARPGNRYALDWKRHGTPYLAELAASRAALKASTSSGKEIKAQRHAAELVRLAEEFPHLERAESRHAGGKLAARNIRTMLKAAFPGQKFSVTSDYNCVRVRWVDGPTETAVKAITGRFNIGRADYNTDYFYTEDSAWSELFGGVQYLFTNRETSPELVAQVLQDFNAKHGTQATPEDWRKQSGPFNYSQRDGDAYCRGFRDMLNATDATPPAKTTRKGAKA